MRVICAERGTILVSQIEFEIEPQCRDTRPLRASKSPINLRAPFSRLRFAGPFTQTRQKAIADGKLAHGHVLVRLMCLLDAARAADQGSYAGSGILACFGTIGDASRFTLRSPAASKSLGDSVAPGVERRDAHDLSSVDDQVTEAITKDVAQSRLNAGECSRKQLIGVIRSAKAELPREPSLSGDDVASHPGVQLSNIDGGARG